MEDGENHGFSGPPYKYVKDGPRFKKAAFPDLAPGSDKARFKRTGPRPHQIEPAPPELQRKLVLPEPQLQIVPAEPQPAPQQQLERSARRRKKPDIFQGGETLLCPDIAQGLLKPSRIPVYGPMGVDVPDFKYIDEMDYAADIVFPNYKYCGCRSVCDEQCSCLVYNGQNPYADGGLNGIWAMIFECNHCKCNTNCIMRASQRRNVQLELFHTGGKGFGVRSSNRIPKGTCVAEYLGFMEKFDNEAEDSHYRFVISCLDMARQRVASGELKEEETFNGIKLALKKDETDDSEDLAFCVDAQKIGNVARFFNHSCDPNLFTQCIVYPSDQMPLSAKQARLVHFASRDIEMEEEITLDYCSTGEEEVECLCGSDNCKKFLKF